MVSNPEGLTDNSPRSPIKPTPSKKTSARKLMCPSNNIVDVKKKTAIRQFRATEFKRKSIKSGTTPLELKPNQKVNKKQRLDKEVSL